MGKLAVAIAQRLGLGLLTIWIVTLFIFLSVSALPGDFATEILGQSALPETIEAFRQSVGLDQPAYVRYFSWLSGIVHGDFGKSFANGRDVAEMLKPRLANTLFLALLVAVISVPIAVSLGVVTAIYRRSALDRVMNIVALVAISLPEFFIAYILILVLAVKIGWLPSLASVDPSLSFWETVRLIALPALTLSFGVIAHMMRMTRAAITDVLSSPFIEMAKLKGLRRSRIIIYHALPNSLSPIITVVLLNLAFLIAGVVVVEVVFVYPGLGQWMVDSVRVRDIPVVLACSLTFAGIYVLINLTADVLSTLTNPRILHSR